MSTFLPPPAAKAGLPDVRTSWSSPGGIDACHDRGGEDSVDQHRGDDGEGDRRPQPVLSQCLVVTGGVGEVVDRSDPADTEERSGPALVPGER